MTPAILTYYRNQLEIKRTAVSVSPSVEAGMQLTILADRPTAAAKPLRQKSSIETATTYTTTFRKRRYQVNIDTPPIGEEIVSQNVTWSGQNVTWSGSQVVWT